MYPLEGTPEPFALHPIFRQDQRKTQNNQQHHPTHKSIKVILKIILHTQDLNSVLKLQGYALKRKKIILILQCEIINTSQ